MAWSSILGHDRWAAAFDHIVRRGRLAHAYLFVGPAGVGKHLFARELAKALLCETPKEILAACDTCAACKLVVAGTHPDLLELQRPEDKNEFPIDLIRDLIANFALKPARQHGKIAILNDADDLNDTAANGFLKTLEEPPPGSLLILIGTHLEGQLPTIRSRCQVVRFAPLGNDLVRSILVKNEAADPDRLVRLAGGSPGRAVLLADPELWAFRAKLLHGLAQPKVATFELAKEFAEFAEEAGKETALHRQRVGQVFFLMLDGLREALRLSLGAALTPGEEGESLQRLADRLGPEKIAALIDRCLEAQTHLDRYLQVSLVLEGLFESLTQAIEL